jgi:hypothetical protein
MNHKISKKPDKLSILVSANPSQKIFTNGQPSMYLASIWARRFDGGMEYHILHISQRAHDVEEELRPIFTLNVDHGIPHFIDVLDANHWFHR